MIEAGAEHGDRHHAEHRDRGADERRSNRHRGAAPTRLERHADTDRGRRCEADWLPALGRPRTVACRIRSADHSGRVVRHAAAAAMAPSTTAIATAPIPRIIASKCIPGSGSARPATPNGINGEASHAPTSAMTTPVPSASSNGPAIANARRDRDKPRSRTAAWPRRAARPAG